jgi:hypothetical protein
MRFTRRSLILPVLAMAGLSTLAAAPPTDVSYMAGRSYAVGSGPHAVVVADFNGDGKADIATANQLSNDVSVLLNHGDGTFGPAVEYAVGTHPLAIAVGDFNGDG